MPLRQHVVIISWEGYHDKAHAIATALSDTADKVSVIYSNKAGTPETGPGTWVCVPQSWYFGRKFRASLDLVGPDELMVQIQADTHSDDWAALLGGCADCFEHHPDVGLWIPDINWTPWPIDVVNQGMLAKTNLMRVAQTDGIVWALHPDLYPALRALDYDSNNLGWGIDWVALHEAETQGKIAVRDMSHPVHHPQSRGYDNAEAAQNMKNFLSQLPAPAQDSIIETYHRLAAARRTALGHDISAPAASSPPTTETTLMPLPFLRSPTLSQAFVIAGHVYIKSSDQSISARASIETDGYQTPLKPMAGTPPRNHVTQAFPLHAANTATAYQQLNDLGDWQVDGWPSLRVIPDFSHRSQSIPLSGRMRIDPADGAQVFCANLAVHRGKGDLVLCLSDMQGQTVQELRAGFETAQAGGNQSADYQSITLELPVQAHPLHLELRVECEESFETSPEQPAVFFIARPRLRGAEDIAPLAPAVRQSPKQRGDAKWYHAQLPALFGTQARDVALVQGRTRTVLLSVPTAKITLLADHGHALELHSDTALTASVWFNGMPTLVVPLEQGEVRLHIPTAFLTGQDLFIELRDASGTYALWRHWTAPTLPASTPANTLTSPLARNLPARFKALQKHLSAPHDVSLLPHLHTALEAVGTADAPLRPLQLPCPDAPTVTVILCADDDLHKTYRCLAALLLAWTAARAEIIVTGAPEQLADLVEGITVLPDIAEAKPRGAYIALLDNDAEVTTGWLDALIDGFDRFDGAGMTGPKLIAFEDSVHSAGGMIRPDGTPAPYGCGYSPRDPRVSYARRVDYLPRTAVMIPKHLWEGHPDLHNCPAPQMAAHLHAAGHDACYVPSAIVYAPATRHAPALQTDDLMKDAQIAGRVLCIQTLADDLAHIPSLQALGYKVTLIAPDMQPRSPKTDQLEASGVEVIAPPFYTTLHGFLDARAREFDVVYLAGVPLVHGMAAAIRAAHPLVRLVLRLEETQNISDHDLAAMRSVDVVLAPDAATYDRIATHALDHITLMPADTPIKEVLDHLGLGAPA